MECKVKDISINYYVIGEGKSVVMLHGYYVDHKSMVASMEPIFRSKKNYKRIYIDLPGMGKSSSAKWIKDSDTMLDVVLEAINKIIPNENFLLVGYSYGGYLARGIVHKILNRIDGLLLICPVIIADIKKRNNPPHIILKRDEKLLSELQPEDAERFNSVHVVQSNRAWNRYSTEILNVIKASRSNFLYNFKKNGYEFSCDIDRLTESFDKPALILMGRQDSIVGYKDAFNILDNYPRATFSIIDGAGHNLQIEQEKLFNSLVSEWIKRVEEL